MLSKELEFTLNLAFKEAREKHHEFMTVEHLLFALLGNPSAVEVLTRMRAIALDLPGAGVVSAILLVLLAHCKFAPDLRELLEPGLDTPVDRVCRVAAFAASRSGRRAGQDLDALVDLGNGVNVELSSRDRFDHAIDLPVGIPPCHRRLISH